MHVEYEHAFLLMKMLRLGEYVRVSWGTAFSSERLEGGLEGLGQIRRLCILALPT